MGYKTPRLQLAHLMEGARHNLVRLNEALNAADAFSGVISIVAFNTNTPPGSPVDGAAYVLGSSPTGVWAGKAVDTIAIFSNGGWRYYTFAQLDTVVIWDETAKHFRFKAQGSPSWAPFPHSPGVGSSTAAWTGMIAPDGRSLMRKKFTFSSMTISTPQDIAHDITSVDLTTVFISGMARSSTIVRPLAESGFAVEMGATNVTCTPSVSPTGWTVDVFIDYAVSP